MKNLKSISVNSGMQTYTFRTTWFPVNSIDLSPLSMPQLEKIFEVLYYTLVSFGSNEADKYYYYCKNKKGEIVRVSFDFSHRFEKMKIDEKEVLNEEDFNLSITSNAYNGFAIIMQ